MSSSTPTGPRASPPLRDLRRQLWHYLAAMRWLAVKLWDSFRWRLVRAVAAALAGVVVVAGGLSLSIHYAQTLEGGELLRARDFALPARDETTLALVVAVLFLVLLAGGGLLFWAQRTIDKMAVALQHHVRMDVALAYGGELPDPADWRNEQSTSRALWILQTRDARRTAIVSRKLLRNTVQLGIAVAGLVALFSLEARMTALFLGIMLVALVAYYHANRVSVRATRRYEAVAPGTRKALHQLRRNVQTLSQPQLARDDFEAALGEDAVAEETHAFKNRFGAHVYTEFLGFAVMGVVLAVLTGYMGREALAGNMPWTRLIAYMVVLRITLGGVLSVFTTFAFFSRFYPSINRLDRFFSGSNSAQNPEPLQELPLRAGPDALTENREVMRPVSPGEMVGVILPVALSRYSLGLLASLFVDGGLPQRRRMLGHIAMAAPLSAPPTAASMRTLLNLDDSWDLSRLSDRLGDQATAVEDAIGLDPSAAVPAEAWEKLPPEAAARLVLVAAEASERPILAVDRDLATEDWVQRLRRESNDKIVLVCSSGSSAPQNGLGISRKVVASAHGDVLAIGSSGWVDRNWDAISERRMDLTVSDVLSDEEMDDD